MDEINEVSEARRIRKLRFHVLSKDEINKLSTVTVNTKALYEHGVSRPNANGPLDLRLGVSTTHGTCETCGERIQKCAGHFGKIELVLPVYHIGFLKRIVEILNCVCKKCGEFLLGISRRYTAQKNSRWDTVREECKKIRRCARCGGLNGVVKRNEGFRIYHEFRNGKDITIEEISAQKCLKIFEMIREEDYQYLELKYPPCNLIIQTMIVPPACIRPSVDMQSEGGFNEDDLTVKLAEIVHTNNLLEEGIEKGNLMSIINEGYEALQTQVNLLINSDMPRINGSFTPIRGLVQRLKGKQGRFRCNLSGKRVDFTGRTVISPDPNLGIEEVGIPAAVAAILTLPEKVTRFNMEWLMQLVGRGMKYPGANYVIHKDKSGREQKRFLMYGKPGKLEIGDVVERHLMDGDIVLFNRQPSLHRMSIMGHRVRVHKGKTFRFNECNCASYNADFDGDEMNIHVPQTVAARSEAINILGTRQNLCTARNGEPLIACTQDFLTGSYLLTSKDVLLTRQNFGQLCAYALHGSKYRVRCKPTILWPVEYFTGKQLFEVIIESALSCGDDLSTKIHDDSSIIKYFINLKAENRSFKAGKDDSFVLIRNNKYYCGRVDKSIIGGENKRGSLFYQLMKQGSRCAVAAMNSISRVSVRYLAERGFSIGLDDVFPSNELVAEKEKIIAKGFREVRELVFDKSAKSDSSDDQTTTAAATMEMCISKILSKVRDDCGNACINELSRGNSPVIMQECGSKGSKINVSQMIACVSQQIISGNRVPEGMGRKTLPHFPDNCMLPEARGFIRNSFFSGLRSYEFFFHAVSGREGLVDTAVKTAETGYMQRRLMKALEDLSVKYDYTVRNSYDDLVQFNYGEDNMEPLKNEEDNCLVWAFTRIISQFINRVKCDERMLVDEWLGNDFSLKEFLQSLIITDEITNVISRAEVYNDISRDELYNTPTNKNLEKIKDIVTNMLVKVRKDNLTKFMAGKRFTDDLLAFVHSRQTDRFFHRGVYYFYFQNSWFIENFISELCRGIISRVIEPCTAVGAIAGQSIGEPGTQMTLKTFHFAGVASMNITLGIPRIKEIINSAVNIATPIIKAQLTNSCLEAARVVKARIEKVFFSDICSHVSEILMPDGLVLVFTIDLAHVYAMRLEITLDSIRNKLMAAHKNCVFEVVGDTIRLLNKRLRDNAMFLKQRLKKAVFDTKIVGLDTVSRVVINKLETTDISNSAYELLIEGTGLQQIAGISGLDFYTTSFNNVCEAYVVLGIEAARTLIINEIEYTMAGHGIKIDHRHVMLLSDMMCFRGEVLGITRFGIGKMRASALMLASFEQTADYIFNAALRGKEEPIVGVSESIIMGVPIDIGTGSIQLFWDKNHAETVKSTK